MASYLNGDRFTWKYPGYLQKCFVLQVRGCKVSKDLRNRSYLDWVSVTRTINIIPKLISVLTHISGELYVFFWPCHSYRPLFECFFRGNSAWDYTLGPVKRNKLVISSTLDSAKADGHNKNQEGTYSTDLCYRKTRSFTSSEQQTLIFPILKA